MARTSLKKQEFLILIEEINTNINNINSYDALKSNANLPYDLRNMIIGKEELKIEIIKKELKEWNIEYFAKCFAGFDYIKNKIEKKQIELLSNSIDLLFNKIMSFKNEIYAIHQEILIKRNEYMIKKEEEYKAEIAVSLENAKKIAENTPYQNKKLPISFFEDNKIYNDFENEKFYQSSEDDVKEVINVLLPQTDKQFHNNVTKFLWLVKRKQRDGIKFKNANFDFSLLIQQWRVRKGL